MGIESTLNILTTILGEMLRKSCFCLDARPFSIEVQSQLSFYVCLQ